MAVSKIKVRINLADIDHEISKTVGAVDDGNEASLPSRSHGIYHGHDHCRVRRYVAHHSNLFGVGKRSDYGI